MNRHLKRILFAIGLCVLHHSADADSVRKEMLYGDRIDLRIAMDRDPLSYSENEPMIFNITANWQKNTQPFPVFIEWERTGDDGKVEKGKAPVGETPLTLKTSLDRPGFIRIYGKLVDKNGNPIKRIGYGNSIENLTVDSGAAVKPETLRGTSEPADFDEYWKRQKGRLKTTPLSPEMRKIEETPHAISYAVKIPCSPDTNPVTGYLSIPRNRPLKSRRIHIYFHGYGYAPQNELLRAKKQGLGNKYVIQFIINAHGYNLEESPEYYQDFERKIRSGKYSYAFDPVQNSNPDTAYFNGMALRVMRALEFLKTLPEWNGKDLVVYGGSQGGLQAIWAAGLDPDVSEARISIPWCCDLGGAKNFGRLAATWRLEYKPALDYFDPINFAKRIKCPVTISRAGLGDYTCPPSGIAVFYNNLACPKEIRWYQNSTHGYVPKDPQIIIRKEK